MAASSILSSKGQITIPLEIRHRLGISEGDRVEFIVENQQTILRPLRSEENPFEQFAGIAPAFSNMDEINAWVRDLRDDEETSKA